MGGANIAERSELVGNCCWVLLQEIWTTCFTSLSSTFGLVPYDMTFHFVMGLAIFLVSVKPVE